MVEEVGRRRRRRRRRRVGRRASGLFFISLILRKRSLRLDFTQADLGRPDKYT